MKNINCMLPEMGMHLVPQHFQQLIRYMEHVSMEYATLNLYNFWGVSKLSIDKHSMQNGFLSIEEVKGVMPDGTLVSIGEIDSVPEGRSFQEIFKSHHNQMDVYLAIPLYKANESVCSASRNGNTVSTRFYADQANVCDENNSTDEKTIKVSKKNFKIFFSGELLDGYSYIKIARINRKNNDFTIDSTYIPPLLNISASKALSTIISGILANLTSKRNKLSFDSSSNINHSNLKEFLFLHTINRFIPIINYYNSAQIHPEELFKTLIQMAGSFITFSESHLADNVPSYSHFDLTKTFRGLESVLQSLIQTNINSPYIAINFMGDVDEIAKLVADIPFTLNNNEKFYLAFKDDEFHSSNLVNEVPKKLRVASYDTIATLVNAGMPGLKLNHAPVPPDSFPREYLYFKLGQSGEVWQSIVRTKKIAINIPEELLNSDIRILVIE